jgi:hypothetical protein
MSARRGAGRGSCARTLKRATSASRRRRIYFINPGDGKLFIAESALFSQQRKIGPAIVEAEMQAEAQVDTSELDQMQAAYKAAVEEWLAAIKQEEALASVNHTIAEVDKWEGAHFAEDEIRNKVKAAKKKYEDALREKFFGF